MTEQVMADDFYASGTFWLTVVIVWLTVILVALGWWAIRSRKPEIAWKETNQRLLIRSDPSVSHRLRVLWDDVSLVDATLKTVTVGNLGKADLKDAHFDGSRPIKFSYSKPPVAVLSIRSTQDAELISCKQNGGVVEIGPGLLRKGESITIALLYGAEVSGSQSFPLPDVRIRDYPDAYMIRSTPEGFSIRRDVYRLALGVCALLVVLLALEALAKLNWGFAFT